MIFPLSSFRLHFFKYMATLIFYCVIKMKFYPGNSYEFIQRMDITDLLVLFALINTLFSFAEDEQPTHVLMLLAFVFRLMKLVNCLLFGIKII